MRKPLVHPLSVAVQRLGELDLPLRVLLVSQKVNFEPEVSVEVRLVLLHVVDERA